MRVFCYRQSVRVIGTPLMGHLSLSKRDAVSSKRTFLYAFLIVRWLATAGVFTLEFYLVVNLWQREPPFLMILFLLLCIYYG